MPTMSLKPNKLRHYNSIPMNRKEAAQMMADNQRTEKLLQATVSQIKQIVTKHTNSLIACVTKHNLPKEVEDHIVKAAMALNAIPGNYEECVAENITALRHLRSGSLACYAISAANKYMTKENILLREECMRLNGLSVQEFSQYKLSGQKLSQKEEWVALLQEQQQLERDAAELQAMINKDEADSGAGKQH